MTPEPLLPPELVDALVALATPVGFRRWQDPPPIEGVRCPPGLVAWTAPYAVLALLPVPAAGADEEPPATLQSLRARASAGQRWLGAHLRREESRGRLMDGYLLLVLPEQPPQNSDLARLARQVELDVWTCRKHVLWPVAQGWHTTLMAVSPLALMADPVTGSSEGEQPTFPSLPARAQGALALFHQNGERYNSTASAIAAQIAAAMEQPDEDGGHAD